MRLSFNLNYPTLSLHFLQTAIYAIISLLRIRFHFPFTGLKSETFGPELYLSRLKTHVPGGAPRPPL